MTDDDVQFVGYFLDQEIMHVGGEKGFLWKAKQPVLCRIAAEKKQHHKTKKRNSSIVLQI